MAARPFEESLLWDLMGLRDSVEPGDQGSWRIVAHWVAWLASALVEALEPELSDCPADDLPAEVGAVLEHGRNRDVVRYIGFDQPDSERLDISPRARVERLAEARVNAGPDPV